MSSSSNKKSLERESERLELAPAMWAEILLLASRWGWRTERPTYFFLGQEVQVTEDEARALASIVNRILETALRDPFAVYPTPVDMAILYQVGEFCAEGAFVIR